MLIEGQRLGEFEILEHLGQGGMGAVFKARQTSLHRLVALKTLKPFVSDDSDYVARFRQEAVAAAALNHPNLVQVYAAGEAEGIHYFAMEYVEGESAQARLDRKGRIEPLEAIAIGMHVATALDYGWRKAALIHRDIKPDNIFLSSEGEVKLGDLGLAKIAGQGQGITTAGVTMGTPHYISPEQAEATKDVDLRADIYSLGCTLYHMLAGEPPYRGDSGVAVMIKHINAPAPDLRGVWPECPAELAAAVIKMMQKQPDERQQSYGEVCADLQRVYKVLSSAGAPSIAASRRWPAVVWVGGAVAACAAVGAFLYFAPWKRTGQPPDAGRHEKRHAAQDVARSEGRARVNPPVAPVVAKSFAAAATPAPNTAPLSIIPAPTPRSSALSKPAPVPTPTPTPTPKPPTEVEKWFAQVDGPQEQAFQNQVIKPFETGAASLRARYLAAVDAAGARATAAGKLPDALAWRAERKSFEKAQNVSPDDAAASAGVKALREDFRQQLARLDQDRAARARILHAQYDAILAKNQTLLTQRARLDDALLLKKKRDEIALAWLGASPLITGSVAGRPESAKPGSALLASKDQPFVNSLGMKFVPVPILGGPTDGQRVLFSVWDTRVQDYEVFATETGREWPKAPFEQGPTHPAVEVNWEDAQRFCQWLTGKEQAAGRLPAGSSYRLPSDHEWSCAVELGAKEKPAKLPSEKSDDIDDAFPWGTQWPPPKGAGNYAGEELQAGRAAGKYSFIKGVLSGYRDDFVNTSPVGSFAANRFGLFDMGGNVEQWSEDWFDENQAARALRGSSWISSVHDRLLSSNRDLSKPALRHNNLGFRCVLGASAR